MQNDEINQLRRNARAMVRELGLLNDAYFNIGVTLAERHLLIELEGCGKTTMGDIAERLLLDKSTVSRLIAKALRKGFIRCEKGSEDKRQRWVELSAKGRQVLEAFEPIAFKQTRDALLTLTPEEVELVYRGVALYAQGLKTARLHAESE
jgi:DNA-binding MarR family transcriptional regulator